jgi:hypothetical protein
MLCFARTIVSRGMPLAVLLASLPKPVSAAVDIPSNISRDPEAPVLRVGPVEAHPTLSVAESFTDNVYLSPDGRESDAITTVSPGLLLQMPVRQHLLSLGGKTSIARYASHSSENTTDWTLYGAGDFQLGRRLRFTMGGNYGYMHEGRSESSTSSIEKLWNSGLNASLAYTMANVSKVKLEYSRTWLDYRTSDYRSRDEDVVALYLYYRVLPRTAAYVEYEFKNVNFTDDSRALDNSVQSAYVGAVWELSERSRGNLKVGYLDKNFRHNSHEGIGDFATSLDVSHYFSDDNYLKCIGARTVDESSTEGSRYSVSTGFGAEFTHRFLDRLSATVSGGYREVHFSNAEEGESKRRVDQMIQAGLNVRYTFRRWLECSLAYNWWERDSNVATYDAIENTVTLRLTAAF